MPERQVVSTVPPLLLLMVAAGLFGVVAQIGVTLALGIARSRRQFLGFILLSLVFSGGSTVLLAESANMKPTVAATIGAMLGAVPSLITLRVGLKAVAGKYGLQVDGEMKELEVKRGKDS